MTAIATISGIPAAGMAALHRGLPFNPITGQILYVCSSASGASNNNNGTDPKRPKSSIEGAFNSSRLSANRGDLIVVLPNHTETVAAAAGLDCDIAGVTVMGIGSGSNRPTINFTATGSDVDIDAANITFQNLLFTGGIDAITAPLDVNAADFKLLNCEWRDVTGQVTDFLVTDANADRLLIDGFLYQGSLTAGTAASGTSSGIVLVGCDRPIIRNSFFMGRFGISAIECRTTAVVQLHAHDLRIVNLDNRAVATAGTAIEDIVTGSTGVIGPNVFIDVATDGANVTEAVTGATFRVIDPVYVSNADDQKALLINWTAVADS